jgi:hypothetical protein
MLLQHVVGRCIECCREGVRRSSQNDLGHPHSRLRRHSLDHTTRRNQCHTRDCSPPRRSSPTRRSC